MGFAIIISDAAFTKALVLTKLYNSLLLEMNANIYIKNFEITKVPQYISSCSFFSSKIHCIF